MGTDHLFKGVSPDVFFMLKDQMEAIRLKSPEISRGILIETLLGSHGINSRKNMARMVSMADLPRSVLELYRSRKISREFIEKLAGEANLSSGYAEYITESLLKAGEATPLNADRVLDMMWPRERAARKRTANIRNGLWNQKQLDVITAVKIVTGLRKPRHVDLKAVKDMEGYLDGFIRAKADFCGYLKIIELILADSGAEPPQKLLKVLSVTLTETEQAADRLRKLTKIQIQETRDVLTNEVILSSSKES